MKKFLLLTLLLIANLQAGWMNVDSINIKQKWRNKKFNTNALLYIKSADSLLDTCNVYYSSGSIGIGISSPAYLLDINGDAHIDTDLLVGNDITLDGALSAQTYAIVSDYLTIGDGAYPLQIVPHASAAYTGTNQSYIATTNSFSGLGNGSIFIQPASLANGKSINFLGGTAGDITASVFDTTSFNINTDSTVINSEVYTTGNIWLQKERGIILTGNGEADSSTSNFWFSNKSGFGDTYWNKIAGIQSSLGYGTIAFLGKDSAFANFDSPVGKAFDTIMSMNSGNGSVIIGNSCDYLTYDKTLTVFNQSVFDTVTINDSLYVNGDVDVNGTITAGGLVFSDLIADSLYISGSIINREGDLGVNNPTPSYQFEVSESASNAIAEISCFSTTAGHTPMLLFQKSADNTINSFTNVTVDDEILGSINSYGVNTNLTSSSGTSIRFYQDSAATTTTVPARISFHTTDATSTGIEHMQIDRNGKVGINNTTPSSSGHSEYGDLTIGNTSEATVGLTMQTSTAGVASLLFNDSDGGAQGVLQYNNSSDYMYLRTAGTNSIIIDDNQQVGIDTTTPAYLLHVNGSAKIQDTLHVRYSGVFGQYAASGKSTVQVYDEEAFPSATNKGAISVIGSSSFGMAMGVVPVSPYGGWIQGMDVSGATAGTYPICLQPIGNDVGIGLYEPTFASGGGLHVDAGATTRIRMSSTATGATSTDGVDFSVGTDSDLYIIQREDADINWYTNTLPRMTLKNSGRIGIGTDDPEGNLHIWNASAGTITAPSSGDQLIIEGTGNLGMSILTNDAGNGYLYFGVPTNDDWAYIRGDYTNGRLTLANGKSSGNVRFNTAGSDRVVIDSLGFTGIGITAPEGRLHVYNGTAGTVTPNSSVDDFIIENSTSAGMSILTPDANLGQIAFGCPSSNAWGLIRGDYTNAMMTIYNLQDAGGITLNTGSSANRRVFIDSVGTMIVGFPTDTSNRGSGVINASAVWDDGTLLTNYVLDYYYDKGFKRSNYNKKQITAVDKFIEYAKLTKNIDKYNSFVQKEKALPSFYKYEKAGRAPSIGVMAQTCWEELEIKTEHIRQLKEKLDEQEIRIARLEKLIQENIK